MPRLSENAKSPVYGEGRGEGGRDPASDLGERDLPPEPAGDPDPEAGNEDLDRQDPGPVGEGELPAGPSLLEVAQARARVADGARDRVPLSSARLVGFEVVTGERMLDPARVGPEDLVEV